MTQRNRATVWVQLVLCEAEFSHGRERDARRGVECDAEEVFAALLPEMYR